MTDQIPRTNIELAALYGDFVAQHIARLNQRKENEADIIQSVWLRLIESHLVERFWVRARRSRPETLTTEEVCLHLGISVASWVSAQEAHRSGEPDLPWLPSPVAGESTSFDALWSADDIEKYAEVAHEYHEVQAPSERLIPVVTVASFRTYLSQAVHNAFANYCRTKYRRHKDRPYVTANGDNVADLVQSQGNHAATVETMIETRQTVTRALGASQGDFVALLMEGYTMKEAVDALGFSAPKMVRVRRALTG